MKKSTMHILNTNILSHGSEPAVVPGHPAGGGGGRDDGGVGERPGPGHAAGLVADDPGVVLLDLGLREGRSSDFTLVSTPICS